MPLQARRPNLPAIALPQLLSHYSLGEDVHTPMPFTPIPFEKAPLVMTPDTPSFPLPPLDAAVAIIKSGVELDGGNSVEPAWTEDEDGVLQSYLMYPPRPLRTSYPPGSLPPPSALDEITTQLLTPLAAWKHSWQSTRSRLFTIARKESMSSIGGHKRDKSESLSIIPIPPPVAPPLRSKITVLGGSQMSRQQHSMDSLYGDDEPKGFSETLRLSNTLQVSAARDSGSVLTSGDGLSSPLAFSYNFTTSTPRKAGFPFPSASFPRPASLLQRGRSFTCDDFPSDDSLSEEIISTPSAFRLEMQRSASSPVSALTISPPSSISSLSISEEMDIDL